MSRISVLLELFGQEIIIEFHLRNKADDSACMLNKLEITVLQEQNTVRLDIIHTLKSKH